MGADIDVPLLMGVDIDIAENAGFYSLASK
ncbi:unknown protein [Waddlia chondrophila 2032/99]|uniref:Uncharacterized protein n=1 Tax=Waddlia chondrophila 2032/99 TaxID=765953 RepID=F8LCG4_9BACT|nr:unknown protein [Waddlia chondrophila 2032/99]